MKRIATIVLACLALAATTARAGVADMEAMLIYASNDPAPLNYKLDAVVPKLRAVLKFQNYELLGSGSASVNAPGNTTIDIGQGHSLDVKVKGGKGGSFNVEVHWLQNGKVLVGTGGTMGRKQPLVLGGVQHKNGKLVVTLTAK